MQDNKKLFSDNLSLNLKSERVFSLYLFCINLLWWWEAWRIRRGSNTWLWQACSYIFRLGKFLFIADKTFSSRTALIRKQKQLSHQRSTLAERGLVKSVLLSFLGKSEMFLLKKLKQKRSSVMVKKKHGIFHRRLSFLQSRIREDRKGSWALTSGLAMAIRRRDQSSTAS